MVAEVITEIQAKNLDQTFSYLADSNVKVGSRVLVPFGKKEVEGFVLELHNRKVDYELKKIIKVIESEPILTEELKEIGDYISKKTLCNKISAYQTMLPSALKAKKNLNINKKYITYISLNLPYEEAMKHAKNEKQKEIINKLKEKKVKKENTSSINTLLKNHIIKEEKEEVYRIHKESKKEIPLTLTKEQQQVVDRVSEENHFKPFLLHGVTGSGKTEVYMNLIEKVIKQNKSAILLVPEISLTPQIVEKFYKRFSKIAILHSSLSNGEKYDEYRKIQKGEVNIVIGARSAIFAPLSNLGIIIIDEEHSLTYKQENNPKYHAIDIALFRGKYHDIPVLLASATPSIESYTKAKLGVYELLELKNRVNTNLPKVTLVDMKEEIKNKNPIFSSLLKEKLEEVIKKNKQAIILLNKRGYTRVITCPSCGYVDSCPYCDIPLTYHKSTNKMKCHYCGYSKEKIKVCPSCKNETFRQTGMGTEQLEEWIVKNISGAKVLRMDMDTTTNKGSHEKIIESFSKKDANILVGTQMISKGLDFSDVCLVGVLNGDSSLNIPDFRSSERTFQLLSQVSGRSGRKEEGEVIIQGFNLDHYSILNVVNHDYESFYKKEMEIRKELNYPPYCNLSLIKLKGKDLNALFKEGYKVVEYIKNKNIEDVTVLGPNVSSIPKVNLVFSIQILLKYKDTKKVYPILKEIQSLYQTSNIYFDIDLNPLQI